LGIKAVVFDYGKVISLPPDPGVLERFAQLIGADLEKLEPVFWSFRDEYDRGAISAREYYKDVIRHLGASVPDDKDLDEITMMDLNSWANINPGTTSLMHDVKKAGYVLGILSNMPHDFLALYRDKLPVFSLPHVSLFSCHVNIIKPGEAIYRKLLSMLELEPAEVVFFDDRADNIKTARDLGMEAFVWENPEEARNVLSSLGVKV